MKANRNQSSKITAAVMETVEERKMFAVTASLSAAGVLTITGTGAADTIVVSKDVGNLKVKKDATHTSTFVYADVKKIVANLGNGDDKFTSDNSVNIKMAVNGGIGNDTITTGAGSDTIHGDSGNDKISGMDNLDVIYGDSGNDTVNGNGGLDEIFDGAGKDNYFGGTGNDYFFADLVNIYESDLFDGGDGTDYLTYAGRSVGVRIQDDGLANDGTTDGTHGDGPEKDNVFGNIEFLIGTDQADGIYLTSNTNNVIDAGKGMDFVQAGPGNDTVYGGTDDDWLFGEAGNDKLYGGSGNDYIDGGANNDSLYGEAGKDSLYGQGGNDKLYAKDGVFGEVVNGGSGTDWAQVDGIQVLNIKTPFDSLTSIESYIV